MYISFCTLKAGNTELGAGETNEEQIYLGHSIHLLCTLNVISVLYLVNFVALDFLIWKRHAVQVGWKTHIAWMFPCILVKNPML